MIRETVGHLRDLPRYRQILASLVRYGYRDVVTALHLDKLVEPFARAAMGDEVPPEDRPMRLRMVCEDLGPTFVKLGQILSTRPDLLPEAYTNELARLRDHVKPFSFAEVESILAEEYGRPASEVFARLEAEPLASASISQVHRARLLDGRTIALKIRRPGIEKVVQADLDILNNLAQLAERHIPALVPYGPVSLARELDRTLHRELDLSIERRTMERCRGQFAREPYAHIPDVFRDYSTPRVLAMELIGGVSVNDLEGLRSMGVDPAVVAVRGSKILLRQIFRFGFFHADPHPGNLRVLPGGIIAPLDYGMFGRIDAPTRERIVDLLTGLIGEDTDRVLRALEALEIRGEHVDPRALRRDVSELVASYCDLTLDAIDLSLLLRDLVGFIRAHHLKIPPDLVLLIRALVTIEGVGRELDPHFDIAAQVRPFFRELTVKRYSPRRIFAQTARTAEDVQRIATLLPDVLGQSLESIKRGELTLKFDLQHFDQLVGQLTRASHTLTAGIVIAGLIVGSSLIVRAESRLFSLGYIGYAIALVLGIILILSLFQKMK
ncbi:ABC1 kinase family protein [Tundrisphaera lichenicola]|uniref:ABC1 kinase family protein n=1 Tax=Tundrisphaera lichenicola TaxID=2029860 RepID=UPI003EB79CAB